MVTVVSGGDRCVLATDQLHEARREQHGCAGKENSGKEAARQVPTLIAHVKRHPHVRPDQAHPTEEHADMLTRAAAHGAVAALRASAAAPAHGRLLFVAPPEVDEHRADPVDDHKKRQARHQRDRHRHAGRHAHTARPHPAVL